MSLFNKNIAVGVTGGIAAYKSAQLVRDLQRAGAHVRVVMTHQATRFVTPLTFQALTGQPVILDDHESLQSPQAMPHIDLARWADLILIAPATANVIGKLAQGLADNVLATTCLAASCPIAIAPAMNRSMWEHTSVQANLVSLQSKNIGIFGPASGDQACGDDGLGRMLEPAEIIEALESWWTNHSLAGVHILITAGPTREPIDPIRYLSNRSSGKMGYALAHAALRQGASVTLVSGPVQLTCDQRIQLISVETALEMYAAVQEQIKNSDLFIASAAVADYRPVTTQTQKIKKSSSDFHLSFEQNPDIVKQAKQTCPSLFTVGFAAETENLHTNAQSKLQTKALDLIIANDVSHEDSGMESDYNQVDLFWPGGFESLQRTLKTRLADQLISKISQLYQKSSQQQSNVRYIEEKKN